MTGEPSDAASTGPAMDRIFDRWDDALSRNDMATLLSLYEPDATLESPLVPYLLKRRSGIVHGHAELQALFTILAARKPALRRYFRTRYLTDGTRMMWEYPRETPAGDQMDFVEVMELSALGLIRKHRVYWGWLGVGVLQRDEYWSD
jgi:hypothetical protein